MNTRKCKIGLLVLMLLLLHTAVFAKGTTDTTEPEQATVRSGANEAIAASEAKYVFFFIGDGMAMPQIGAAEAYAQALSSSDVSVQHLAFSSFPVTELCTTYDAGSLITDSASAGTAFASGNKTLSGVINMNAGKSVSFKTIAEYARESGRKVGIVSSVSIDHATPAAMYAKVPSRGNMYDIAVQLSKSGFDYFGGGGLAQPEGKNKDQLNAFDLARAQGYTIINRTEDFHALKAGAGKIWAVNEVLQDSNAMPYELDRKSSDLSLADYTKKGIELLQDDPEGFFFFVEGGKIDWACHANDAASAIMDTLAFDAAVREALLFAEQHPAETLIVVSGDHETGGMTMGFAGTQYSTFYDKVAQQNMSFVSFNEKVLKPYKAVTAPSAASLNDLEDDILYAFGIDITALNQIQKEQLERALARSMGNELERSIKEEEYLLYGGYEPLTVKLTQILNQTAGIGWTSYAHTGVPVPLFAKGVGQDIFGGYYDNTDIFYKLAAVMGIENIQ